MQVGGLALEPGLFPGGSGWGQLLLGQVEQGLPCAGLVEGDQACISSLVVYNAH